MELIDSIRFGQAQAFALIAVLADFVWLPNLSKLKPLYQTTSKNFLCFLFFCIHNIFSVFAAPSINQPTPNSIVFYTNSRTRAALGSIFVSV